MKIISMYGMGNRDKSFLALFLGRILSQNGKVIIYTDYSIFYKENEAFNYSDALEIRKFKLGLDSFENSNEALNLDALYIIYDISFYNGSNINFTQGLGVEVDEKVFFLSRPMWKEVEANEEIVKELIECYQFDFSIILLHLIYDCKIHSKYLTKRYKIHSRKQKIYEVDWNEKDMAVLIEGEFDEELRLRSLSKQYKQVLLAMVKEIDGETSKEHKKWLKLASKRG